MSESYIILHKPEPMVTTTPKRKSISNTTTNVVKVSKEKERAQAIFQEFEQRLVSIKEKIHGDLFNSVAAKTVEYFQYYMNKRRALENFESANQTNNVKRKSLAPVASSLTSSQLHLNPLFKIIPTIALFTGINTQDFANLYENLLTVLKKQLTRHVFVMNEKNTQNMKSVLNSINSQWESDTENEIKFAKKNILTVRRVFDTIIQQNRQNPGSDRNQSVVFIFKQFELIPKETIENLIILISNQIEKLPVFLVFESASQTSIVNEQLNCQVISKLCIKQLYMTSTANLLDKFLTELFIDTTFPFKISGDILKHLLEVYNDVNTSLESFIHCIKFCFHDYLMSNEAIIDEFESIDEDPSVSSPRQRDWLGRFNNFVFVCRILHELLVKFPTEAEANSLFNASNRRFNILFARIWQDCSRSSAPATNFVDSQQYMNLRKLIKLASTHTFDLIVQGILDLIKSKIKAAANDQLEESMFTSVCELNQLLEQFKESIAVDMATSGGQSLNKVCVQTLELREIIIEKLNAIFRTYLCYNYVIANSGESALFLYDNLTTFKQRLFDVPRLNIHNCLRDSITYMRNNYNLETEADETPKKRAKNIIAKLPCSSFKNESTQVLCYVYQIYLECGHMINLHDWLQAFVERLENEDLLSLDKDKSGLLQALFFRSITELQFMGLIKPTSRKVDHVIKLTNSRA